MTITGIAFVSAVLLTGLVIPLLRRARFLDIPNQRSSHAVATPRGGGLAVLVVISAVVAVGGPAGAWVVLAPALVLGLLGLRDDLRSLSSAARLVAQLAVGIVLSWGIAERVGSAGLWAPTFVAVGALALASYVNAFNFMDGVNGISALNAAVAALWIMWLSHHYEIADALVLSQTLVGAALGFLVWNARSRVFLGDVGSYGLGALTAGGALMSWAGGVPPVVAAAPLLVYLADTGSVIVKRALAGKKLTEAHREHAYQRLVQAGWPHLAAAAWSAVAATLTCVVMAKLYDDAPVLACVGAAAVLGAYLASPLVAARVASGRAVAS